MMFDESNVPHVYYTIEELSLLEDESVLESLNIKAIGYVRKKGHNSFFLRETYESSTEVELDLINMDEPLVPGIRPYIIFGIVITRYKKPVICVKSIKQFDANMDLYETYKKQCLVIRNRFDYQDIVELAKARGWSSISRKTE